ncbi:hypothetical protein F0562_011550 [Nyssa sinensis]|uniref:SGS domain-containing protein n=1 Tax=Nyssa sinensis TaxID=561372 RepID=A0A5J4ZUS9_9ASTE|nr:hypothetical protein F0562_011550 [Nyssa sinensis]
MRELEQEDLAETVIEEGDEAEGVKPLIEPQWNATAVINWAIFSTIALHGTKRRTMLSWKSIRTYQEQVLVDLEWGDDDKNDTNDDEGDENLEAATEGNEKAEGNENHAPAKGSDANDAPAEASDARERRVESNRTVLSTNWNEVSSKKVEDSPPDGMELKKWEV